MPPRDPVNLATLRERTFAAVLLDLDGTLIDSDAALYRAWVGWAGDWGVAPERLQGMSGRSTRDIVAEVVDDAGARERALADILRREVVESHSIRPHPGAERTLAALPVGTGAVVTSSATAVALARLAAAGLPRPVTLITADDVEQAKPAPECYLAAADDLGVDPADCLVVEDAPAGVAAGRAAGCSVLVVNTGTSFEELTADGHVPNLGYVDWFASRDGVRLDRRGSHG